MALQAIHPPTEPTASTGMSIAVRTLLHEQRRAISVKLASPYLSDARRARLTRRLTDINKVLRGGGQ